MITPSIIKLQVQGGSTTEFDSGLTPSTGGKLTLSDHSRSPLGLSYEMIERSQRMIDGTMRKYVVAKKRIIRCDWIMLPTIRSQVVDGHADARDMKGFYEEYCYKPIDMTLYYSRNFEERQDLNYTESIGVFWDSFNFNVVKRFKNFDYWNVTAQFTEI